MKKDQKMKEEVDHPQSSIKERVLESLKKHGFEYRLFQHEPVYTMEQAALVCGHTPEEGVKVLLLELRRTKSDRFFGLVVWQGTRPVDFKDLAERLGAKKANLASPEKVEATLGIEIGALAPFGYSQKLPVVFDSALLKEERLFINAGVHDETIELNPQDLLTLIKDWSNQVVLSES